MGNLVYWKEKWEEEGKDYALSKNTKDKNIEIWNKSSKSYDEAVGYERIDEVISNLERLGYINEESIVLDIGCGTGAYTIPLSGICKKVYALDYSDGMLNVLQNKINNQEIENIEILNKDWNNINLVCENMSKKYDFVISSLNPGCYNFESLLKMNEASKSYCCYISTNGKYKNEIIKKADEEIVGHKIKRSDISNIIYPFNILYFSGYEPKIFYSSSSWIYKMYEKEAIEKLENRYNKYLDNNIRSKIKDFVKNNMKNNLFVEKSENTLGIITWEVSY
ncbi:class I SAM-dependent methyltransferase [Romboutsia lituseburensis]|uniref:class I SAM-dependent methyltransferase n=1 Tax=Romboutsia lituseburensis TaxID=1537 RepID=UPI0022EB1BCA|nr:class I SAM-dependent methyltransferase [Romboutsia lituseburensis]